MHTCPVCGYDQLLYPPEDFTICPSCGTEFGYHDSARSHRELRLQWIRSGALWQSAVIQPPPLWNGYEQLIRAAYGSDVPFQAIIEAPTGESRETIVPAVGVRFMVTYA